MKLHATLTSDKGYKKQSGEYLNINIFTTNKEAPTHRIEVRENAGVITVETLVHHFGKWRTFAEKSTIFVNQL